MSFGRFLGRFVKMPSITQMVNLRAFSLHNPKNPHKGLPLELFKGAQNVEMEFLNEQPRNGHMGL